MWIFNQPRRYGVELDPTEREFFINNQTDRSSALIRETIQNSLDAKREDASSVVVKFAFYEAGLFLPPEVMDRYLDGLMPHLRALETELNLDEVEFASPRFLTIEDFGTHGLRGDPARDNETDFYYFWRVVGRCGKGDTKGGRWGLGKTVFPNSSQISAHFGYNVPSDRPAAPNLFGQAALKTHRISGTTYLPYAFFTKSPPAERELPFDDPETLAQFRRDFQISRGATEPGLSIVVPFPHPELTETSLLEATVVHYFFPILAGDLVVHINQRVVDRNTITRLASDLHTPKLRGAEQSLAFATAIQAAAIEARFQIDFPDQLNSPAGRVPRTAFTPENLTAMRKRFNDQQLLALQVPVEIHPKAGAPQPSFFNIYLKKDPALPRGYEYYIRGGISITGHQTFGGRQAYGLLLAQDRAISKFLGDVENPAHTAWQSTSQRLAKYRAGRDTLLFIRESMVSLLDTLMQAAEEEDPNALIEFFYTPRRRRPATPAAETPEPQPLELEDEEVQPRIEVSPLSGGFKVSYSGNGNAAAFPLEVSVLAAYEIRLGNPFKKYHPDDFDLRRSPIQIAHRAVRNLKASGQRLDFIAEGPDFEVQVTGFDPRRDLKVRAEKGAEQ